MPKLNKDLYVILRQYFKGSRKLTNILWAAIVTLGGFGFLLTGVLSFLKSNFFFLGYVKQLLFVPQGFVLTFYGTVGTSLGIFIWLTVWWNFGSGYNQFNKNTSRVTIYRKGFLGLVNNGLLELKFREIKSIKMHVQNGLNPKRQLLLFLHDGREIPLLSDVEMMPLSSLEESALNLTYYLDVPLESFN